MKLIRLILNKIGVNAGRIAVEWVSAAEAPRFVQLITAFSRSIHELGPLAEDQAQHSLRNKLEAAKLTLEGPKFRMAFAKQAREAGKAKKYGEFPSEDKLLASLNEEMTIFETLVYLREKERDVNELSELMSLAPEQVMKNLETLKKRNFEWRA